MQGVIIAMMVHIKKRICQMISFKRPFIGLLVCILITACSDKFQDMDKFYRAYRKFAELIHSDQFNVHFRLEPGDIFGFNNRRVLHGRTEFDPNSGRRHLQGYYIDRAEIIGRLNFFKKQDLIYTISFIGA